MSEHDKKPDDTRMSTIEKAMLRMQTSNSQAAKKAQQEDSGSQQAVQAQELNRPQSTTVTKSVANRTSNYCELDFATLSARGFMTPASSSESMVEEYRIIKRPLLDNAKGKSAAPIENANLLVVTSAMPGEGKTYTSMNLAISMAMERNIHVLLIDSDVIKPSLTDMLGLTDANGLTDLLTGEVDDLSAVLYKTNLQNFTVLPAGRRHKHDTELLSSDNMHALVQELSQRYPDRIVIFDAPPILATSHARVMTNYGGQIVLVVEAGKTPEFSIKEAVSQIAEDKVVGVVLNKSRGGGRTYYGGYGAYGGYGTYGEHKASKE